MKDLLKFGLFYDALELSPRVRKRDIIDRIIDLKEQYTADHDMIKLLNRAQEYLTVKRTLYDENILPCMDYLNILLMHHLNSVSASDIAQCGFVLIEEVEKQFEFQDKSKSQSDEPDLPAWLLDSFDPDKAGNLHLEMLPTLFGVSCYEMIRELLGVRDDYEYLYFDGECDNTPKERRMAYRMAMDAFQKLPEDPSSLGSLGFSLIILSEFEKALQCFMKEASITTKEGIVYNNIAWCQLRLGRYEEALLNCQMALKYMTSHSHIHHDHAAILMGLNRLDEAFDVAVNALNNLQPRAVQLSYLTAVIEEKRGRIPSAVSYWLQYLQQAEMLPGHERAMMRAQQKLQAYGIISDNENSFKIIAEGLFESMTALIKKIRDNLTKTRAKAGDFLSSEELSLKSAELERLDEKLKEYIIKNETKCEKIFNETFELIVRLPPIDRYKVECMKRDLLEQKKKHNIPYFILVRDALPQILSELNSISYLLSYLQNHELTQLKERIESIILPAKKLSGEIDVLIRRMEKSQKFLHLLDESDVKMDIEAVKYLAKPSSSLKKNRYTVFDAFAAIDSLLKDSREAGIEEFDDYSVSAVKNATKQINSSAEAADESIKQERANINNMKAELNKIRELNKKAAADMKKRLSSLSAKKENLQHILMLLDDCIKQIAEVSAIKHYSGFMGWLSGGSKKLKKAVQMLENLYSLLNDTEIKPKKSINFSKLSPERVKETISSKIKQELLRIKTNIENLLQEISVEIEESERKKREINNRLSTLPTTIGDKIKSIKDEIHELEAKSKKLAAIKKEWEQVEKNWLIAHYYKTDHPISFLSTLNTGEKEVIYFGSTNGDISLIDQEAENSISRFPLNANIIHAALNEDGDLLIYKGSERKITVWSREDNSTISEIQDDGDVFSLAVCNPYLFVGGRGEIRIYELPQLSFKAKLTGFIGETSCLVIDNRNSILYSTDRISIESTMSVANVWNINKIFAKKPLLKRLNSLGREINALALSSDGKVLACGVKDDDSASPGNSTIVLWDAESFRMMDTISMKRNEITSIAFSQNGLWLASVGHAVNPHNLTSIDVFALHKDRYLPAFQLNMRDKRVNHLLFTKNNNLLVSGGGNEIFVWDLSLTQDGLI